MNKQEANKLLGLMKANYANAFKSMSQQEKYMLLETWTFTLQDIDAHVVFLAAMQLISTSKWPPTVAEIREKCKGLYYEASCHTSLLGQQESDAQKKTYAAIANATSHLRGDNEPMLTLEAMLRGDHYALNGGTISRMLDEPEEQRLKVIGGGTAYEDE